MKMTPPIIIVGSTIIFASVLSIIIILPWTTISDQPSDIFRERTALEDKGREVYVKNGCTYCQWTRSGDLNR